MKIIYGGLLILSVVLYFRYIFGYFMRNFERQADLYVFSLFPSVRPLISTFSKIVHSSGQPADKPNWHHFSIQQRVDYLNRSESDPRWIVRHDQKVRNSIFVFIFGLVVGALAVFQLNQFVLSQNHNSVNIAVIKHYIEKKTRNSPKDAPYYFLLGDFHMETKAYEKAIDLYVQGLQIDPQFDEKSMILSRIGSAYFALNNHAKAADAWSEALTLAPDNSENLNNLAWLKATTEDKSLYDPAQALELAQKALEIKKTPYIWDTYAQALFINGEIEAAIKAERQALALNPEERQIYEDQLAKFLEAN
jgi:tetratricopeptide (TPR) repeat protein